MEDHFFEKIPGLEKLLESRDFEDLTRVEQELILGYMSREDYTHYRETIRKSRQLFASDEQTIKADPATRLKLLDKIKKQEAAPGQGVMASLIRALTFRIPAYQPGFAVAILALLFIFLHNNKVETTRYLTRIDTVYLEKEITQNMPVAEMKDSSMKIAGADNGRKVIKTNGVPLQKTADREKPSQNQLVQNAYQKMRMVTKVQNGRSAADDSALMKFLVTVN